jgi:hypothetical protein
VGPHVLEVAGLAVDLGERLDVLGPPLPQEEPLGAELERDQDRGGSGGSVRGSSPA